MNISHQSPRGEMSVRNPLHLALAPCRRTTATSQPTRSKCTRASAVTSAPRRCWPGISTSARLCSCMALYKHAHQAETSAHALLLLGKRCQKPLQDWSATQRQQMQLPALTCSHCLMPIE